MENAENAPEPKPFLYGLTSLLGELHTDATERYEAKQTGKQFGASTGIKKVDEALSGYLHPGTHAVHAPPGAGKTALALQIAATCRCPALFVTCEMPPLELLRRHAARVTKTFLGKFKTGDMPPDTLVSHARKAAAAAPHLFLLDATQSKCPASEIKEASQTVRLSDPTNPFLLVIVDSLHSWADAHVVGDEYTRLNEACATLRNLAHDLNAPVLFVAEQNRDSMGKSGQNSGAGTRKIEYGCETVFSIDALDIDKDKRPVFDVNGETKIRLAIAKNRHGELTDITLMFHGATQSFREV